MADLGISTGGDLLGHVLALGTNSGGDFTPDGLLDAAEQLASAMRLMAKEVFDAQPDVPDDFFAAWSIFTRDFTRWKGQNSSWFSRVWNVTRDELVVFVGRYNDLRAQWVDLAPTTKAPTFTVKSAPSDTIASLGASIGVALKSVGIGAAVLVGAIAAGYFLLRAAGK